MFGQKKQVPPPSHPHIERARQVSTILDSGIKVPVVGWKIGLDPLLGLLPVGGDVIAGLLALYLIAIAYQLGMPNHVLIRMAVYTLADILLGLVPVVGDVADFFWKSNRKNLKVLEEAYRQYGEGYRHRVAPAGFANRPGETTINVQVEPIPGK